MRNAQYCPDPEEFQGFRFVASAHQGSSRAVTKFTDVGPAYPFWGASKRTWYVKDRATIPSKATDHG